MEIEKSSFATNDIFKILTEDIPSVLVFSHDYRGWFYRSRNLKIRIKKQILSSDYYLSAKLCGYKIHKIVDGCVIDNYGLMKYIVSEFVSRIGDVLVVPDILKVPKSVNPSLIIIAIIISYNTEQDVKFRYDDLKINIQFKKTITKVVIKNDTDNMKSYYKFYGNHRSQCAELFGIF
jgi:hypothetical protein